MSIEVVETSPSGWERTTLGVVCKRGGGFVQTGPFGSQLHASDYVDVGVPSIMPVNLGGWRVNDAGIARVPEHDAHRLARHRVQDGDIVFSRRGDVERHGLVTSQQAGWLCGTGCLLVRPGKRGANARFLSLWLRHPDVRAWLVGRAVGTTMPNLNTTIMSEVPIALPPVDEQRAIAEVLGALDDKIELNRQMNHTLEEMASALFKSWFIDFDPVVAKAEGRKPFGMDAATAALFPAALEASDDGPLPVGWQTRRAGSVIELAYGKGLPAPLRRPGPFPVYGSGGTDSTHAEALVRGPGIIVGRKGTVGSLFWEPRDFFPIDTTFYVRSLNGPDWMRWVYQRLRAEDLASMGADSAVPGVNRNEILDLRWVVPPDAAVRRFETTSNPWRQLVVVNEQESRTLAALRDALLPKLLSGEVRLKQAEKAVEAAL